GGLFQAGARARAPRRRAARHLDQRQLAQRRRSDPGGARARRARGGAHGRVRRQDGRADRAGRRAYLRAAQAHRAHPGSASACAALPVRRHRLPALPEPRMRLLAALFTLVSVSLLSGCPAAIVGAGALTYGVAEDRRTSGTMIDDDNLETRVSRGVRERYGENTHVNVTSFNRSVLLTGEVPEDARKADIEKLAQGAGNVR